MISTEYTRRRRAAAKLIGMCSTCCIRRPPPEGKICDTCRVRIRSSMDKASRATVIDRFCVDCAMHHGHRVGCVAA